MTLLCVGIRMICTYKCMAYTHYIPLLESIHYQCIVKSSEAINCEIAVYTSYSAAIVCIRYKLTV